MLMVSCSDQEPMLTGCLGFASLGKRFVARLGLPSYAELLDFSFPTHTTFDAPRYELLFSVTNSDTAPYNFDQNQKTDTISSRLKMSMIS
jgi:hypothetical protein